MDNLLLYNKLTALPESLKSEVLDFIDFLVSKNNSDNNLNNPKPKFGSGRGTFTMHPNFDEPLEDFKDYMN